MVVIPSDYTDPSPKLIRTTLFLITGCLIATQTLAAEPYQGWQHSGLLTILTTPDGANLPASASVEEFPLLVRLQKDRFDFSQAKLHGEDLRFSTTTGKMLAFEIEEWDSANGTASIWVRVYWSKADAASESNAHAVFNC
jgi:hypothetical protein